MSKHALLSLALTLLTAGFGQAQTAELRLQVQDPSGAAMPATGSLSALSSSTIRSFHTDDSGGYTFSTLPYGRYRLEVSSPGFANQALLLDLQSSAVTQTISMSIAPAPAAKATVVAATPLPGESLALDQIAAPVQTANQLTIERSGALDLTDFLNRRLNGVHVNEVQENPFQPDVNYRGYTASPILGTPQGLSVYMDGVRLNQPFADVVSWDLIPRIAIAEVALMPGSNPLFGLNTLGGALSLQTKDGNTSRGTSLEFSGGSFGRRAASIERGGSRKSLSYYTAANLYFEDGWRAASQSNVRQFFGKLGWQHKSTMLGIAVAYANNLLSGNALQEQRLLAADYASVYTIPDITANRSPFLNVTARHNAGGHLTFFGNAYYRYLRTNIYTADVNEGSLDQSIYQPSAADRAALTAAGYSGFPTAGANAANTPFPKWRCIAQALQRAGPGEKCNAFIHTTHAAQHNAGAAGQTTWFAAHNQLTAGAAWDRSGVTFAQTTQLGYINPDRSITGINAFADGVTGGSINGEPFDRRVNLGGLVHTGSIYATDTLSPGHGWNLTLSGRYNRTRLNNDDRITPLGAGTLTSHNVFSRLNPAVGVTYAPGHRWNVYFGYNEGSRAPTSIELGCADPALPCKLPNALAGDPPLQQVITRTWETGVRGGIEPGINWSAGWFRADNRDDILFVSSTQTGFGYFKNFGKTRRQGLEADMNARIGRLNIGSGYTFLDATYQSLEIVNGSNSSANDKAQAGVRGFDGDIRIQPGDRLPLIPRNVLKAYADLQATSKISVDLGLIALSDSFARGNENNRHRADGVYYLGPGRSPGYALLNLGGRYQMHRRVRLFVEINNLLDRRYYTAAQLSPAAFTSSGAFQARPLPSIDGNFPVQHSTFFAPGAPRNVRGGLHFNF